MRLCVDQADRATASRYQLSMAGLMRFRRIDAFHSTKTKAPLTLRDRAATEQSLPMLLQGSGMTTELPAPAIFPGTARLAALQHH
jgi:hypothetical protein